MKKLKHPPKAINRPKLVAIVLGSIAVGCLGFFITKMIGSASRLGTAEVLRFRLLYDDEDLYTNEEMFKNFEIDVNSLAVVAGLPIGQKVEIRAIRTDHGRPQNIELEASRTVKKNELISLQWQSAGVPYEVTFDRAFVEDSKQREHASDINGGPKVVGQAFVEKFRLSNKYSGISFSCELASSGSLLHVYQGNQKIQIFDLSFTKYRNANSSFLCEKFREYLDERPQTYSFKVFSDSSQNLEDLESGNNERVKIGRLSQENRDFIYRACLDTDTCIVRWPFWIQSPAYMARKLALMTGFADSVEQSSEDCKPDDVSNEKTDSAVAHLPLEIQPLPVNSSTQYYLYPQKGYLEFLGSKEYSDSRGWTMGATLNFSNKLVTKFGAQMSNSEMTFLTDFALLVMSPDTLNLLRSNRNSKLRFLPMLGDSTQGGSMFHQKALFNSDGRYVLSSANYSNIDNTTIMDMGFSGLDKKIQNSLKNFFLVQAYELCAKPQKILCALNSRFQKNKDRYHQVLDIYSSTCDYLSHAFFKNRPPVQGNEFFFEANTDNILKVLQPLLQREDLKNVLAVTHMYSRNQTVERLKKMTPGAVPFRVFIGSAAPSLRHFLSQPTNFGLKAFNYESHLKGFLLNFKNQSLFLSCTSNLTFNAFANSKEFCFLVSDPVRLAGVAKYLRTLEPYFTKPISSEWLPIVNGKPANSEVFVLKQKSKK